MPTDSAFSPSRRTASPLVTDCESEACELRTRINQTERLLPMDFYSADGTNTKTWLCSVRRISMLRPKIVSAPFGDILRLRQKCPSLPPVFARKPFVQRDWAMGGRFILSPVSLPFSFSSPPVIKNGTQKGRVTGEMLLLPSRASMPVNRGSLAKNGRRGGNYRLSYLSGESS